MTSNSAIVLTGNTITANGGGGISVSNGTLTLSDNTITGNAGRGIALTSTTATLTNNRVIGNTFESSAGYVAPGGGIYAANSAVVLNGNRISGNTVKGLPYGYGPSAGGGGGLYLGSGTAVLSNNIIRGNTATGHSGEGFGGGVYMSSVSSAHFSNNVLMQNRAGTSGGGLYHNSTATTMQFDSNAFIGNTAPTGSAAYYTGNNSLDLSGNLIFGNLATTEGSGATLFLAAGYPEITLNNIYGNTSTYELWNNNDQGTGTVSAGQNWWGTDSSSQIMDKIYDFFDNAAKSMVDFSLFLTSPHAAVPVPSIDKLATFRPADGTFYLDYNGSGTWEGCGADRCLSIGMNGDIPLVGDWNGSGTDKVGAFRPSDGTFYLDYNGSGTWDGCGTDRCLSIGMNGDIPLVGDWNGSGTDKVGAFRPSDGTFYLDYNGNGVWDGCGTDRCLQIGMNGDIPLVGDWNASGTSKVGAFRPSDGTFYLDYNGSGTWEGCGTDRCLADRDEWRHPPRRRLERQWHRQGRRLPPLATAPSTWTTTAVAPGTAAALTAACRSAC